MGGATGNPAAAAPQAPDINGMPNVPAQAPTLGQTYAQPTKPNDPLATAKAALLGFGKALQHPQQDSLPPGQPVQQVAYTNTPAPASPGNYPATSLAKRNLFGGK